MTYKFISKSVWLEKEKILVISDLHLGYEEMLSEEGVFLPRFQYKKIIEDLEKILEKVGKVKEVIILGDLKHEFGRISRGEWRGVLDLIDYLSGRCGKIILVRGNHDTVLGPIARKKEIKIKGIYIKDDLAFLHGHKFNEKISDKKIRKIFLGHMHPAISIREGVKSEVYKCFLVGKWKNKEIVILPSFFPLVEGSDVIIEETNLATEFKFNLKNFRVCVVGDKVYDFKNYLNF